MAQATLAMERLRAATRAEHRRLEALPYFAALRAGTLPVAHYVGLLAALRLLHETVEAELVPATGPVVAAVWDERLRAAPLLTRDLAFFAAAAPPPRALLRAAALADALRQRCADAPAALLGVLYVLEGSALGGVLLRHQVARAFGLRGRDGLAYLTRDGRRSGSHWARFRERMDAALARPRDQAAAVAAARAAYAGLIGILVSLDPTVAPDESGRMPLVAELNPEAGRHGVTGDARELQAALRAGHRSWRQFPYYRWRYGARGRAFTRSDSAWLVTLVGESPAVVRQQIRWLGRLLAARGMPQWLLESHLRLLHDELVAARPDRQRAYGRLLGAATMLAELRRAQIDDAASRSLAEAFDRAVGAAWRRRLPEAGTLLVAAVADERAGIGGAVPSLEPWLTDSGRFPAHWRTAVHRTIDAARRQAP